MMGGIMGSDPTGLFQYLADLAWRAQATADTLRQRAENMKRVSRDTPVFST